MLVAGVYTLALGATAAPSAVSKRAAGHPHHHKPLHPHHCFDIPSPIARPNRVDLCYAVWTRSNPKNTVAQKAPPQKGGNAMKGRRIFSRRNEPQSPLIFALPSKSLLRLPWTQAMLQVMDSTTSYRRFSGSRRLRLILRNLVVSVVSVLVLVYRYVAARVRYNITCDGGEQGLSYRPTTLETGNCFAKYRGSTAQCTV